MYKVSNHAAAFLMQQWYLNDGVDISFKVYLGDVVDTKPGERFDMDICLIVKHEDGWYICEG